ncbi:hypothetical protein N7463_002657 [Penicillium fimorum]|uniref:Calcium uniporter protein, mitochondrial n=1 Tax=Penicillium fimorum TaxID=1882269 RepID=A0A9W9Y0X6_9EURO|nr:hypothetical protein N7463_002657 [Penicillium fimorum]
MMERWTHAPLKEKLSHLDPIDIVLALGSLVLFMCALEVAGIYKAWNSAEVVGLLAACVVATIAFVVSQYLQGDHELLVSRLLNKRLIAMGMAYGFFHEGAFYLLLYYVPIYFQVVVGVSGIVQVYLNCLRAVFLIITAYAGVAVFFAVGNNARIQPRKLREAQSEEHCQPAPPPNPHTNLSIPHNNPPSPTLPNRRARPRPTATTSPFTSPNLTTANLKLSPPLPPTTTFAGYTTHSPLRLETKYYTTEVPVWVDEIPLAIHDTDAQTTPISTPTAEQWKTDFLSTEAEIVREAVGALVVCAHTPSDATPPPGSNTNADPAERPEVRALRDLMRGIGAVKERIDEERGGLGDVPGVFVLIGARKVAAGVGQQGSKNPDAEMGLGVDDADLSGGDMVPFSVGWWEDQLFDMGLLGWEVIEWDPKEGLEVETRNQYGEREGMPRIKEVLETHDWSMVGGGSGFEEDNDPDMDSDDDLQDQPLGLGGSRGFGNEVHELEREMFGLRMAIERGGGDGDEDDSDHDDAEDEMDVESMEALMMRMQAIKNMSSELPEGERKRFAAKAVQDIMLPRDHLAWAQTRKLSQADHTQIPGDKQKTEELLEKFEAQKGNQEAQPQRTGLSENGQAGQSSEEQKWPERKTKGKMLTTPSRLFKLIIPLTTISNEGHDKAQSEIEPIAILVHPQQPLSYLERLIQSELPPIKGNTDNLRPPAISFIALQHDDNAIKPKKRIEDEIDLDAKEKKEDFIPGNDSVGGSKPLNGRRSPTQHRRSREEDVETYSYPRNTNGTPQPAGEPDRFVRWSQATEIGDFIRDAARAGEFIVTIEGAPSGLSQIRVTVPSFNERTYYLRMRLRKLSRRIQTMASVKEECDALAHRGAQRVAIGGFGILAIWWFTVYRLTFETDLGWDTMEPVTYLVSLSTLMGGYLWFLYHNREISYKSALDFTISARQKKLYQLHNIDLQLWESLIDEGNSLRGEIKNIAAEYDTEWNERADEQDKRVTEVLKSDRRQKHENKRDDGYKNDGDDD